MKIGSEGLVIGDEKWADVPGYEGFYCVSTLGRVANVRHVYQGVVKMMTQTQNGPYKCVQLSRDGGSKTVRVDKLVAMAFLGMQVGTTVGWIDGNRSNARLDNLVLYKKGGIVPAGGHQYVESAIYAKASSGVIDVGRNECIKHPIYGVRWFSDGNERVLQQLVKVSEGYRWVDVENKSK
jgi:hypothetical protein